MKIVLQSVINIPIMLAALLVSTVALALDNPDTGPGCGLGKKMWNGWKGQKQIAPQVFIASTNVTGSYTFAISSGTSGCSNDGTIWDAQRAGLYMELNYASLMEDMAKGSGEHIASLAALLRVPEERQQEFFQLVQAKYGVLVASTEPDPIQLQQELSRTLASMNERRLLSPTSGRPDSR